MTDDFVMPPVGPEMDAMVDAMVGWGSSGKPAPPFSTRMDFALAGLDDWREQHPDYAFTIDSPFGVGHQWTVWLRGHGRLLRRVEAPTLAEAICRAIILAAREVRDAKAQ